MTLLPVRRAVGTAVVAFLSAGLSVALTACGGDEPSSAAGTEAAPGVLTEDQLSAALLVVEDLPRLSDFVITPGEDQDTSAFKGTCLAKVGALIDQPKHEPDAQAEVSFIMEGPAGQSSVTSRAQSYADAGQVVATLARFAKVVGACPSAQGTSEDGLEFDLDVASDQEISLDGVDEQVRVIIEGSVVSEGVQVPVDLGYDVARIANNLVIISTFDIGDSGVEVVPETEDLAQTSVNLLAEITG